MAIHKKCKSKMVLAHGYVYDISPDQEPYESGKLEKIDLDIEDNIEVCLHICLKCEKIIDIWID
jgi:hypothetical protein